MRLIMINESNIYKYDAILVLEKLKKMLNRLHTYYDASAKTPSANKTNI